MIHLVLLLVLPAQVDILQSSDFSRKLQLSAITATVRIRNVAQKTQGSGVIIGRKEGFVYILTARHLVQKAGRLEVATFSLRTYPKPEQVYPTATVAANTSPIKDLALIRLATKDRMPGSLALPPAQVDLERKAFPALSVGCSGGASPTCLLDQVLGKRRVRREGEDGTALVWEIDRKQARGRSGGPLVDKRGYLLGVCNGTNKEKSYFCHAQEIRAFLKPHGFK